MIVIVYSGNRNQLALQPIYEEYEKLDFDLASRKVFKDHEKTDAIKYAKKLAKENGLVYIGRGLPEDDGFHYLD